MPGVSSWNNQWTGQNNLYVIVRNIGTSKKDKQIWKSRLENPNYMYSFGDGWVANVEISEVTDLEARKLVRKSQGFCGYGWMVNSICKHNKIQS